MLPFLNSKSTSSVIVAKRSKSDAEHDEGSNQGLVMAMEDLISALHSKDAKAAAAAFEYGFNCLDSEGSES